MAPLKERSLISMSFRTFFSFLTNFIDQHSSSACCANTVDFEVSCANVRKLREHIMLYIPKVYHDTFKDRILKRQCHQVNNGHEVNTCRDLLFIEKLLRGVCKTFYEVYDNDVYCGSYANELYRHSFPFHLSMYAVIENRVHLVKLSLTDEIFSIEYDELIFNALQTEAVAVLQEFELVLYSFDIDRLLVTLGRHCFVLNSIKIKSRTMITLEMCEMFCFRDFPKNTIHNTCTESLQIFDCDFEEESTIECACFILRNFPNLESLGEFSSLPVVLLTLRDIEEEENAGPPQIQLSSISLSDPIHESQFVLLAESCAFVTELCFEDAEVESLEGIDSFSNLNELHLCDSLIELSDEIRVYPRISKLSLTRMRFCLSAASYLFPNLIILHIEESAVRLESELSTFEKLNVLSVNWSPITENCTLYRLAEACPEIQELRIRHSQPVFTNESIDNVLLYGHFTKLERLTIVVSKECICADVMSLLHERSIVELKLLVHELWKDRYNEVSRKVNDFNYDIDLKKEVINIHTLPLYPWLFTGND